MFPAEFSPIRSDAEINVRMTGLGIATCLAPVERLNRLVCFALGLALSLALGFESGRSTGESGNTPFQNAQMGS